MENWELWERKQQISDWVDNLLRECDGGRYKAASKMAQQAINNVTSSNGRTPDSESGNTGSSPVDTATHGDMSEWLKERPC